MKIILLLALILFSSCCSPKVNGHWRPSGDVLGRMFSRRDSVRRDSLVRMAHKQSKINNHEYRK